MRWSKESATPKPEKPPPERRIKGSRNPLRRHSTARDMQVIPSPNLSMTELADTSSRQGPRTPDPSQEKRSLSRSVSAEPQPAAPTVNGEESQHSISQPNTMANGTTAPTAASEERRARPPSTIYEEVCRLLTIRVLLYSQSLGWHRLSCGRNHQGPARSSHNVGQTVTFLPRIQLTWTVRAINHNSSSTFAMSPYRKKIVMRKKQLYQTWRVLCER